MPGQSRWNLGQARLDGSPLLHGCKSQLPVGVSLIWGHCGKLHYRSSRQASRPGPVIRV